MRSEPPVLLAVSDLDLALPGGDEVRGLSVRLGPGLTMVLCRDERLARALFDRLHGGYSTGLQSFWEPHGTSRDPAQTGRAWLAEQRVVFTRWNTALEDDLVEAFGMTEHVDKPHYMLSRGSARKLGLVAAFACGAELAYLVTPFAALDGPSRLLLTDLLSEAAAHESRGWVVADFEAPRLPGDAPLAAVVDLDAAVRARDSGSRQLQPAGSSCSTSSAQ